MKALIVNCTLKASAEKSNTEVLAEVVADALHEEGVDVASVRAVDHSIPPGVESEMGEGDEWPGIRSQILDSEILIFATPTKGPGPGEDYSETEEGHEWSHSTGRAAAANLLAVARALESSPIPAPPSE